MAEDDRTKKRNELKSKNWDYTGYDDDEFTVGRAGIKKDILTKYDDELNGTTEIVRSIFEISHRVRY